MREGALLLPPWYTLRSGGAPGADSAFEHGALSNVGASVEIYLPWRGFNGNPSPLYGVTPEALELAEEIYGPRWKYISHGAKALMARNCYQVLGKDLNTPSDFVVCYTSDGCKTSAKRSAKTGGTGQAIDLANRWDIPIYNLYHKADINAFRGIYMQLI